MPEPSKARRMGRWVIAAFAIVIVAFLLGPRTAAIEPDSARVINEVPTDRVADALGANSFEARLRGHGLPGDSLATATATDWMRDALHAITIGARLGDSVVVIGLSTGGTLAVWLAARELPYSSALHSVVLISPNFAPRDPIAKLLLWPWSSVWLPRVMPEIVLDDEPPPNDDIARMSTARFPIAAVFPMQALVRQVDRQTLQHYHTPTLVLYHRDDPVVDTDRIAQWMSRIEATGAPLERELVTQA